MMQCQPDEALLPMTVRFLRVLHRGLLREFADDVDVHVRSFISIAFVLYSLFRDLIVLLKIVGKGMSTIKLSHLTKATYFL